MSAGQEIGSPIRKTEPCSRRRYRQTRPEGRSPPPRGCLRSGYPLPSTPPRRHSHPDCRAVLTLIVAQQLRSNIRGDDPGHLWRLYLQLVEIEQAFRELKNDLSIRPIHHQLEDRIEAHIFVAFLAYGLMVTLKQRLKALAPGLTPRAVLEKLAAIQMIDVELPTTDGRTVALARHTEPENDHLLLLQRLKLALPPPPPPKNNAPPPPPAPPTLPPFVVPTFGLAPERFQRLRLAKTRQLVKSG